MDLSGVDLLSLVQDDTHVTRTGATKGGEYHGPCPRCGGVDRFVVWPDHPSGRGEWWCRGCDKGGDAVAYLVEMRNMGFREAFDYLGVDRKPGERPPSRPLPLTFPGPKTKSQIDLPEAWTSRAERFVSWCEAQLWDASKEATGRDYLAWRGIEPHVAKAWRLGWNPKFVQSKSSAWGLPGDELVPIQPGLVIPWLRPDGKVVALKIRVFDDDGPRIGKDKFSQVRRPPGCPAPGLFGFSMPLGRSSVFIVEGELDAILFWQQAGDWADVVSVAMANAHPRPEELAKLSGFVLWFVVRDNDEAGEKGSQWWSNYSKRVRVVTVPQGKDITEFHQASVVLSLAGWAKGIVEGEGVAPRK